MKSRFILLVAVVVLFINSTSNGELAREKRGIPLLTFPRTAPTRIQVELQNKSLISFKNVYF